MNFSTIALLIVLIIVKILANALFIASAIKDFKDKKYFSFGVDVTLAITSLAILIKAVVF